MFHDAKFSFRINSDLLEEATEYCDKNSDRYDNLAHYIRCAVIKLNRIEKTYQRNGDGSNED